MIKTSVILMSVKPFGLLGNIEIAHVLQNPMQSKKGGKDQELIKA